MRKIIWTLMVLVMAVLTLPMQAQDVTDSVEVADTTMIDSVAVDTLKLP